MATPVYLSEIPHLDMVRARFWSHVDQTSTSDACWLWTGAFFSYGYGAFSFGYGPPTPAHRMAYLLTHGALAPDLCVLHRCDTPACCRPDHLWLGTTADNVRDKIAKGRHKHGEQEPHHKLTAADVREIRRLYAPGCTPYRKVAARYGVNQKTIYQIVMGTKWKHLL